MGVPVSTLQRLSPEQLMQRVAEERDRSAFAQLFQHYAPRLKSWLLGQGLADSMAEDILQDTWIAIWQKADRFDPLRASFSTWLFTIARHRRSDRLRERTFEPLPDFHDEELLEGIQKNIAEDHELVDKALKALPPDQHHLLYEMFYRGKTHHEIATEQHLPLGTVKSRARLAMDKLRKMAELLTLWLVFIQTLHS
jgi:RNA polymerase sigma-70 factor (ECF subfamily)